MNEVLRSDLAQLPELLRVVTGEAEAFLSSLENRPAGRYPEAPELTHLPETGLGAAGALETFRERHLSRMTGSAGPRYLGFVTGGVTPAALIGDWLVGTLDQNVSGGVDSGAPYLERQTLSMLRELFGLSPAHSGSFVTGATMANFVGLALGRQWVGRQHGRDVAQEGLWGLPPIFVLSGTPHSSLLKAAAMCGLGRANVQGVTTRPGREAVEVGALEEALRALNGQPCVVVANSGTVNTVDFDDLRAIARLRDQFPFWLHVDAAFGGFAAVSPRLAHLVDGLDLADSVAIDAHKWLNVPYDAAMQFTRHRELQLEVFRNAGAAYLGPLSGEPEFVHLTPENSRRFRALPVWFTLMAYGRAGQREIVERNVDLARALGERIQHSEAFRLLSPVHLNVTPFTLREPGAEAVAAFLARLRADGRCFMTPTTLWGTPGIRAAWSNWRSSEDDLDLIWEAMHDAAGG